ncbi:MAG TPA: cyclic nucleotide-binding domain-containing protein, partial [Deltaproteobacteria bacterium]|nr:cyclic nucleotide-binding domain-containing protein [Deltaproteobacteria bacterium]
MRAVSDSQGELAALRRALELQVDQGQVLEAIATCKAILAILPGDEQTLETLDLLYLNGAPSDLGTSLSDARAEGHEEEDAPLDSLLLTEVVPGAQSVQMADAQPGRINEIPIELTEEAPGEAVIDLRLDQQPVPDSPEDLAAAQVVSLPTPLDAGARKTTVAGARGASLRQELANTPLFGDLDPASLHTLIRRIRVVTLEAGQVLFRQGDAANSLYVIVEGAVVPIAEGERRRKLAVLERGEFFGEIGLMAKQPRNATIEAIVPTKLLAIDRRVLWELIAKEPSVAKSILRFLRARLIDRQMRTNPFFAAFAHAEREAVARQFRILEVKGGTRVVEQGKPPDGLFVVLSGTLVQIDRKNDKEEGELHSGDVFGGLSLLDDRPAPADVVTREKCWLVVLGEGRFRRILEANPALARVVRRVSGEKRVGKPEPLVKGL